MQINIDKKSGIFIGIIAVLVLVIAFISFGSGRSDHRGMHEMGMHEGHQKENSMNGSGQMFLQMMIPHHEQAIEMSVLALAQSKNPEILKLATQIKDGQSAEVISMKSWLDSAEVSEHMGHDMDHGMGGMLTPEELSALKSASVKEFDKLFLTSMIAHHEGALHMVLMIKDSEDPKLRTLYENIVKIQSAEIELMKKLI